MTTNDVTIRTQPAKFATDRRPTRTMIAIGAATMLAAAAVSIGIVRSSDDARPRCRRFDHGRTPNCESITQDLVDRGQIPPQTLDPRPLSPDEILRDLVDRGQIPPQSLDPRPLSRDEILRDLVDRGQIPPQSLDPMPDPATTSSATLIRAGPGAGNDDRPLIIVPVCDASDVRWRRWRG